MKYCVRAAWKNFGILWKINIWKKGQDEILFFQVSKLRVLDDFCNKILFCERNAWKAAHWNHGIWKEFCENLESTM